MVDFLRKFHTKHGSNTEVLGFIVEQYLIGKSNGIANFLKCGMISPIRNTLDIKSKKLIYFSTFLCTKKHLSSTFYLT